MDRRTFLRAASVAPLAVRVPAGAAAADEFTPLAHLPLAGAKEAVVDGATVYVALTDGFATVDVSDPAEPAVLAERRDLLADREEGPLARIYDLAVDGDRLAVAGPANGSGLSGVLLYDVADPADPRQVAFHETAFPVHNCDLVDGHAYLTGNDGIDNPVVVVEAGEDPGEVSQWTPADHDPAWRDVPAAFRTVHDVTVSDGVACCSFWDAGTWLLDVSDPADPTPIGKAGGHTPADIEAMSTDQKRYAYWEPPGNAHYAETNDDGSLLAVGAESWDANPDDEFGGPAGVDLFDLEDPACPRHLATIEPLVPEDATRDGTWTTAHNFELAGDRLYTSWYRNGVKVHDVSDPADPEELAHWRDEEPNLFWTARQARPGEFFVASHTGTTPRGTEEGGLYVFPDGAGSQPDQPELPTGDPPAQWTPSTVAEADCSTPHSPTSTPTATPGTPSGGASPTDDPTPPDTASPTPGDDGTDPLADVITPGFGLPGALAAVGGLAYGAWRRTREE